MPIFEHERAFPEGFTLSKRITCTCQEVLKIVEDVWKYSAMQDKDKPGWNEDDVRLALHRVLGKER